jgi:hypothetical protein
MLARIRSTLTVFINRSLTKLENYVNLVFGRIRNRIQEDEPLLNKDIWGMNPGVDTYYNMHVS